MQARHSDPARYFEEAATSCSKYYIPYIEHFGGIHLKADVRVLEVGCGTGGNLSPFAAAGCEVEGVDIHQPSIDCAAELFAQRGLKGDFCCANILRFEPPREKFDLIMLHDVIEHIHDKEAMMHHLKLFLKDDGLLFIAFPAWQMPFGGHQQMVRNHLVSKLPFIHLLPRPLYGGVLRLAGEAESAVDAFMEIRDTRLSSGDFERLAEHTDYDIIHRQFYLINPHYEVKFGLRPRLLTQWISKVRGVRNFFATSCHYLLRMSE